MRHLLFIAIIIGAGSVALAPAKAALLRLPSLNGPSFNGTPIEKVGYWQREYRRYGYPAPYAYYPPPPAYAYPPPVYGYQLQPPAYAYSPPVYDQAPPPAGGGNYPSAEGGYGDYPPADEDYAPADGEAGDYPANGS
jgi:hypothetical protein